MCHSASFSSDLHCDGGYLFIQCIDICYPILCDCNGMILRVRTVGILEKIDHDVVRLVSIYPLPAKLSKPEVN